MTVRLTREVERMIEQYGHTVDRVEEGRHIKFYLTTTYAGKQVMVCSRSMSDAWRGIKNIEGLLKRWGRPA